MGENGISDGTRSWLRKQLQLYLVMDLGGCQGRSAVEIAAEAIAGGVTMVQLRDKKRPLRQVIPEARKLRELCRSQKVPFIVNDRVDIALLLDADGVHVGQDDLPGLEVRSLFPNKLVGISAGSPEEVRWAVEQQADYLGIGPVFVTATKADAGEAIGFDLIRQVHEGLDLPMVGIGGIHAGNAQGVITAGADGVAVVSAITRSSVPREAAAALKQAVEQARRGN